MNASLRARRPRAWITVALLLSPALALGAPQERDGSLVARTTLLAPQDKVQVRIDPTGRWVGWLDPTGPRGRVVVVEADEPSRRHALSAGRDVVAWDFAAEPGYVLEVARSGAGEALWRTPLPGVEAESTRLAEASSIRLVSTRLDGSHDVVAALRSSDGAGELRRISPAGGVSRVADLGPFDAWYVDGAGVLRAARRRLAEETRFERRTASGDWVTFASVGPAEETAAGIVSVSRDGERLWYVACEAGDETAVLRELDLATGAKRVLAADPEADLLAAGATTHPRTGAVQSVVSYRVRLHRQVLDDALAETFAALDAALEGDPSVAGVSADGARWLVRHMDGGPHDYYLYDAAAQRLTRLFRDVEGLEGVALATRRPFQARSRDGLALRGDLYLPPGSDPDGDGRPSEPLPTVLFVHGGPWVGYEWNLWPANRHFQLLASRGYAVLRAGFRGELGYGRRYVDAGDREWGRRMQDDLVDLALAAEQRGVAAPGRIAIFGGSYGGYAVAAALSSDDVFACGVALYGVYDLEAFLRGPLGATEFWRRRVGDPRTEAGRELLRARSPLHAAAEVEAPLLVSHGGRDERVPIAQSDALVDALVDAGAPVAYLVFPDEGHDYARLATWEALWAAAESLLARCLGGRAEPPGDALARSGGHLLAGAELLALPEPQEAPPAEPVPFSHAVSAYAAWSPDGARVVFQSSAAGGFDLYTMRSDGSEVRLLEASPADDITPAFSPDGTRILFVSERTGDREIFVLPSEGGEAQNLSRHPASDIHPWWSADGERILFSSNRSKLHDDDFDLFEMAADGSDVRQLTRGPEVDTYGSWSPDGRRIVTRRVVDGNSEVFVLDADGSNPRNLSNDPAAYDGWPCWSPDGRRIAFAGGGPDHGNRYLYLIDPDGTRRTQLTFPPAPGAFRYDTHPAFSPDGRWIAFTRYAVPMPFERAEIWLLRVRGA